MKKILIILTMFLCLFSCSFKEKNDILFLGNDLKSLNFSAYLKEKNISVDNSFIMQDGYMSFLYSFVVQNAKSDGISIKQSIKKSKTIYIHIGTSDIYRLLGSGESLSEDIIANQKELFSYYFFLTLEEIREIFNKKIYLLSPYVANFKDKEEKLKLNKILDDFYGIYQEVADYFSCTLVDLRDISLLLENGNKKDICDYVYQKVNYGN